MAAPHLTTVSDTAEDCGAQSLSVVFGHEGAVVLKQAIDVAFADGHADYVDRLYAHDRAHYGGKF